MKTVYKTKLRDKKGREEILRPYLRKNNISATEGVFLCNPETVITVVIPAFNEESYIGKTLLALSEIPEPIEILIVDNQSTDKTKEVVLGTTKRANHTVTLFDSQQKGPVYARKRGMGEIVAQYVSRSSDFSKPRYIAMTDADTCVEKDWIKNILKTVDETGSLILGGVHEYPNWIDKKVENALGIKDFFGDLSKLAYFLTANNIALVQTNGANFAIEVAAYAAVGGSRQPTDLKGNPSKGSDRLFGQKMRELGESVAFIPVSTTTSPRRNLRSLSSAKDPSYFRTIQSWVDIRNAEDELLKRAIEKLSLSDWNENKSLREISFVNHNIFDPLLKEELDWSGLKSLLGAKSSILKEVTNLIEKAAKMSPFEKESASQKLSEKYSREILDNARKKLSKNY